VLAIETATIEVGAALSGAGGLLAAVTARPGRRHAETLHPAIDEVLRLAGAHLGDLVAVAVDTGPGLFTGLRVGVAAAKGLAMSLGIPVVACTSLEVLALAAGAVEDGQGGTLVGRPVVPVVDLRRGEVAWTVLATAVAAVAGEAEAGGARLRLGSPETLAGELAAGLSGIDPLLSVPPLLVGDGARRYGGEIAEQLARQGAPAVAVGPDFLAAPPVAALVELARHRLERGAVTDAVSLAPTYLREADARINWATRDEIAPARAPTP
jgi:tRNA threonylcarbamoyladenosine biosynthesis protein TsaB